MWFSPDLGIWRRGQGVSQGIGTQPADAAFHPAHLKNQRFRIFLFFFDIMITENDDPTYVKHVIAHIRVVFTIFGSWVPGPRAHLGLDLLGVYLIWVLGAGAGARGYPKGLVHNLVMQLFILQSSKIQVFKFSFF